MKIFLTAFLTAISVLFLQNAVIPFLPKNLPVIKKVFAQTSSSWNIQRDTADANKLKFWYNSLATSPLTIDTTGNITASGGVNVGGFPSTGFAAFAKQNGEISIAGSTWTDIPGATASFTLPAAKRVGARAYGGVAGIGGSSTYTHCGFRFVADNTPYGEPTFGDQIVGVGKSGHPGWWMPWYIERDFSSLAAGSHTIKVQVVGWTGSDVACKLVNADYSAARITVETR